MNTRKIIMLLFILITTVSFSQNTFIYQQTALSERLINTKDSINVSNLELKPSNNKILSMYSLSERLEVYTIIELFKISKDSALIDEVYNDEVDGIIGSAEIYCKIISDSNFLIENNFEFDSITFNLIKSEIDIYITKVDVRPNNIVIDCVKYIRYNQTFLLTNISLYYNDGISKSMNLTLCTNDNINWNK